MKNPLVTRAHFYTLRREYMRSARQTARTDKCPGCFASLRSVQGLPPLRRLCVYPSALCGGNSLLVQTISVAESENPISLTRPSTENVGGLFLSIIYQSGGQNHARKEIEKLQSEKEKVERQLAQEQHKIQRLENRAAYYEKGEWRKRVQHIHIKYDGLGFIPLDELMKKETA